MLTSFSDELELPILQLKAGLQLSAWVLTYILAMNAKNLYEIIMTLFCTLSNNLFR